MSIVTTYKRAPVQAEMLSLGLKAKMFGPGLGPDLEAQSLLALR